MVARSTKKLTHVLSVVFWCGIILGSAACSEVNCTLIRQTIEGCIVLRILQNWLFFYLT